LVDLNNDIYKYVIYIHVYLIYTHVTLFDLYRIHHAVSNHFHFKFVHNDNALYLKSEDALLGVAFSGAIPFTSFEFRWVKLQTQYDHASYLTPMNFAKLLGACAQTPVDLNTTTCINGSTLTHARDTVAIASCKHAAGDQKQRDVLQCLQMLHNTHYVIIRWTLQKRYAIDYELCWTHTIHQEGTHSSHTYADAVGTTSYPLLFGNTIEQ
jgi:hypothetical protein